jgi:hypothetical protein
MNIEDLIPEFLQALGYNLPLLLILVIPSA